MIGEINERRLVVLLGMHRSGTSIATRLLTRVGLEAPRGELVEADPDNARGYWESRVLTDLDDDLLRHLGAPSHAPLTLEQLRSRLQDLSSFRSEAVKRFSEVFPQGSTGVWKDPRLCMLWPFWEQLLGTRPAVVVHRDPLEVADSLARRDELPVAYSLALWERYSRSALLGTRSRVHIEDYADLRADPQGWISRVRAYLVSCGHSILEAPPNLREEILNPRATPASPTDHRRFLTSQQRDLLELLSRVTGTSRAFVAGDLPEESPTTELLLEQARDLWWADLDRKQRLVEYDALQQRLKQESWAVSGDGNAPTRLVPGASQSVQGG